jgi:hypothetical protein
MLSNHLSLERKGDLLILDTVESGDTGGAGFWCGSGTVSGIKINSFVRDVS